MKRVSMEKLIEFGVTFMTKRGVPAAQARYLSRIAVETEAFRQSTHGISQYLFIHKVLDSKADPGRGPEIIRQTGTTALLDGTRCFGVLAMKLAQELAMEMARREGTGLVAVRNTLWVGALGTFLIPVAEAGFLGHIWAQTSDGFDCAPFGGIDPRFSTNPMALAFPTDGDPVVADFSTTTMSMGGTIELIRNQQKTATPRFLDKDGNPTNDPTVVKQGGTLTFMGGEIDGHKGYALSLFNEAMAILAGGSANNPKSESNQSFSFLVIDPAAFGGREYFQQEMQRFLAHVRSSRPLPGKDKIRLPGERGFACLADCRQNGIPLDETNLTLLRKIAVENEMEPIA